MLQATTLLFFPILMAFAALSDLFTMTISNRISIALVAVFVPFAWLIGLSGQDILIHLACGFGVLVLTFGMFAFGWIGGGDAKLAAATSVWIGWQHLGDYGLYATFLGGVLTLLILALRKLPVPGFALRYTWVARLHDHRTGIPYGIALAIAGLLIYPDTGLWTAASLA
jgi:prepilin peptidase CpaA